MIGIIDYGVGNVNAFQNIYKTANINSQIVSNINDISKCSKLILPGVGHFDHAMTSLLNSGLKGVLDEMVIHNQTPVLGICVGMQMMARSSEEGKVKGLGWFDADVKKIDIKNLKNKPYLPHMGWNDVKVLKKNNLIEITKKQLFYFLHSYCLKFDDFNSVIATSDYGEEFACIANKDNIYGIQCHPEKSHSDGISVLQNFAKI